MGSECGTVIENGRTGLACFGLMIATLTIARLPVLLEVAVDRPLRRDQMPASSNRCAAASMRSGADTVGSTSAG